ncbi:type III restriction-modification system endonuclease [Robertmurraya sp. 2P01SA]|uniref:type III restriction-modification system endonuclease n=1 Tax=Robertmurraya sp. 2P01SA TaxID=3132300 RepID=UPI0039A60780
MRLILKKDLPHQTEPIQKLNSVFRDVRINKPIRKIENPILDLADPYLYENIKRLQNDLPFQMQGVSQVDSNYLNIDIKMETGTGKTYVYTKSIYELNKYYGFNKFIIIVPSLAIKAGTENFINNPNNINHFKNVCGYKAEIKLQTIESVQRKKGTKTYIPTAIADFVESSNFERSTIQVMLINMQHLTEAKTGLLVRNDYDSTIAGYSRPIDAISATRPFVIIDEPHRFKRDNVTFKFIENRIKPQVIVRYGATFPDKKNLKQGKNSLVIKDYQNLIYDLNIHKSFQDNLIKGVAKEHVESPTKEEEIIKVLSMKKGEFVRFQKRSINENGKVTKSTRDLKVNDPLSLLSPKLHGITIDGILASKVLLSNGDEKVKGDEFFADVYTSSYIRESIRLALKRHFEIEKENFHRKFKIKTLALFFIDDIHSYRDNNQKEPFLKNIFEDELKNQLEAEINKCSESEEEYKYYLELSLQDIKSTHAGYFSEDNIASDLEIEKEVNAILFDKEKLLSLNKEDGTYNTRRFIFSKWTLREGWDNPNIFTIAKLRIKW